MSSDVVHTSSSGARKGVVLSKEKLTDLKKSFTKNMVKVSQLGKGRRPRSWRLTSFSFCVSLQQEADMNNELQSEAIDMIISAIDKQNGNYEVRWLSFVYVCWRSSRFCTD